MPSPASEVFTLGQTSDTVHTSTVDRNRYELSSVTSTGKDLNPNRNKIELTMSLELEEVQILTRQHDGMG
ncbi:hypothetical protein NLI96_g12005 [Meripilus lineatus]|uniref:Uncharacterized protein n=1 Tax=Meripilus lineatus TaxID=2056292 RepID=A0AAD5UQV8_9APHY|nr:hypothetical protein NLI96_g12005 [Physisporinus lineatus]